MGGVLLANYALGLADRGAASRSTQAALTVVDGATVAASLRPGVGVFVAGATASYRPVDAWAGLTGARPGLVTYYSGWGDSFQARFARWAHKRGAVPFVQMEPTGVSVASIALGASDTYLREFARAVRAYRWPVAVSFGPEANGPFYSWGCRHTPAETYVTAWRHIHQIMARAGASEHHLDLGCEPDLRRDLPTGRSLARPSVRGLDRRRRLLAWPRRHFRQRARADHPRCPAVGRPAGADW
jgi:hypothetical protein